MRRLRFKKIDAFAQGRARGNVAAAAYLERDDKLEESQMLRLARELAGFVTEVAYVQPVQKEGIDYRLTYYSTEREVDFCGHATIAATYDLIQSDPKLQAASGLRIVPRWGRCQSKTASRLRMRSTSRRRPRLAERVRFRAQSWRTPYGPLPTPSIPGTLLRSSTPDLTP